MTTNTENRRAGFEAHMAKSIPSSWSWRERNEDGYLSKHVEDRWRFWNAALESVCVEIPETYEDKKMKEKILEWFANGRVGESSKAMACCLAGLNGGRSHPCDPDDLNRCLLLLKAVPDARDNLGRLSSLSPVWAALVARWEEVEASFLDEVGLDWCKADRAPKTYALMKEIGC